MSIDASLAVVIVNYGAASFIISHLNKTLEEMSAFSAAKIFIADNGGPGDDFATLTAYVAANNLGERVSIVDTGSNLGFAGGNNAAFAAFGEFTPDHIFLLNPDAWPIKGAVERLAHTLEAHPDAAIVAPRITDEHGVPAVSYFKFPTITDQFLSEPELDFLHRFSDWKMLDLDGATAPIKTDWVSGAAFLLRGSAAQSPPMDDGYFLYFEETDMMHSLAQKGWTVLIDPGASVVHIGGLTTGAGKDARGKRLPVHWYASWRRYFINQYGLAGAILAAFLKLSGILVYYAKQFLCGHPIYRPKYYFRDFARYALAPIFTAGRN